MSDAHISEQSQEINNRNEESKEYEYYQRDLNYEEPSSRSHSPYSSDSCSSEYAENPSSLVIKSDIKSDTYHYIWYRLIED